MEEKKNLIDDFKEKHSLLFCIIYCTIVLTALGMAFIALILPIALSVIYNTFWFLMLYCPIGGILLGIAMWMDGGF